MANTLLFLHIPKAGGATLANYIYRSVHCGLTERPKADPRIAAYAKDEVCWYPGGFFKEPREGPPEYVRSILSFPGLRAIVGHFSFGLHRYTGSASTYVTLLRDPIERVLSLYYHVLARRIWSPDIGLEEFARDCPVHGWICELRLGDWYALPPLFSEEAIRLASRTIVDNDQTRRIAGVEPPFGSCDRHTLKQAVDNLTKHFAVVGLVEHFDESLLMMIRHFNWDPQLQYLPRHINRTKPIEQIPESIRKVIQERNALDWELYQRAEELYERALKQQGSDFGSQLAEFRERNRRHRDVNEETVRRWEIRPREKETTADEQKGERR